MTLYVVTVTFRLRLGTADAFLPLMRANARTSLAEEPGCRRFEVCLPERGDGHEVFLYELYDDRAAFDAHLASAHYREFDAATRHMIESKQAAFLLAETNP